MLDTVCAEMEFMQTVKHIEEDCRVLAGAFFLEVI